MSREHAAGRASSTAGSSVAAAHGAVGKQTLVEAVQRRVESAAPGSEPEAVKTAAAHGTSGPAGPLPHRDRIQQLFGRHDVSAVRAHVGGSAAEGAAAMGGQAYATGDQVAFASPPDLHTAAHEAAHVVQQRAGVHLTGGVGEVGDPYEQHADAVADAVVAGMSAEPLLDQKAAGQRASHGPAVQRKQGFSRSPAYAKNEQLDKASRLLIAAVQQTPALKELLAFLKSDDNGTFIELDTYEDEGGAFGKTNVFVSIHDTFRRIDWIDDEELANVKPKSELMIRIMLNVTKIGKPIGGSGTDETVGVHEIVNTLAHELSLHAAKFKSIGEAIRGGASGANLGKFLTDQLAKGQAFDDQIAHMQLLTGTSPEYEAIQRTIVGLMENGPKGDGLDARRYQRDIVRDRAAQAMGFELKKLQDDAGVLYDRIVDQFGKAAGGQQVDYPELIEVIDAFLNKLKTWREVQEELPNKYPLLKDDAAVTFFEGKYDQLSDKRTHVVQLMKQDMERRKPHDK